MILKGDGKMVIERAAGKEIDALVELRLAYLQEDFGTVSEQDTESLCESLPKYFREHLNRDLFVYVAKVSEEIVACAYLFVIEKPMSPAFLNGKTGTVLNVYTKPEYRKRGYAKQLMCTLLEDAKEKELSVVELKVTDAGYSIYKSVGFEDVVSKYHNMRIKIR